MGSTAAAYFFMMVMLYLECLYCEAFPDMEMPSWIATCIYTWRFFGGVPLMTVPDNFRMGVFNGLVVV